MPQALFTNRHFLPLERHLGRDNTHAILIYQYKIRAAMEHFCSAVALAFGEAQPGDTYTCGVRIECEFALCAGSATAPRL